jgi:hypothetical protein
MRNSQSSAARLFSAACEYISAAGLEGEIAWQRNVQLLHFSESDLLREGAWVILCSGFREATVRRVFDYLSLCFFDWESASKIASSRAICLSSASAGFSNMQKLNAIVRLAEMVVLGGFEKMKEQILANPIAELQVIPFIGPTTAWHLAKNLGFDSAKPDRHLVRAAAALGFGSPLALCESVSQMFNEQVKVVDLILWRYLADNPRIARNDFETVPRR